MADYYGLRAISKRMGFAGHSNPVYRLIVQEHFLAYKKRKPGQNCGAHQWYTNDALILQWETARCVQHREQLIGEHRDRETWLWKRCEKTRERYGPTGVKFHDIRTDRPQNVGQKRGE